MVHEARAAVGPASFAGGVLDPYRHVCAFVNGQDVDDRVLDAFVRQGVEQGDRLLYLVDRTQAAEPVNRLRHLGFDAAALLDDHRCEVRTWDDTYLRTGRFDQVEMLDLLDRMLVAQPSPRTRMIADMGWAVGRDDAGGHLIEFEARANFIHARHQHVVICSYDTSQFDGTFILDILRTHPLVYLGGMLQQNPFFVDPSRFLAERADTAGRRR